MPVPSTGEIAAPRIDAVSRSGTISAVVMFSVPASEQNADNFEISIYASSGPGNVDTDILVSNHTV
jgi:hypothetical protein